MKATLTLLVSAIFPVAPLCAQLSVLDSLPAVVIADLLEGDNLTISGLQLNCAPAAMGQFIGTSGVPINQGLVLTTGSADQIAGPVWNMASIMHSYPGDADLEASIGLSPTYDACVLEFDCVPAGDTLLFNFAFGSEEYPEYVNSGFNDVFAIYLSGPGFIPAQNVAAIPDGTPVAINNVNAGLNAAYFVDNETAQGQELAYDGYTTNLTAFAVVVPNNSYHFKMAVADAMDGIMDSGVLLEAFSFRSTGVANGVHATTVLEPTAYWADGVLHLGNADRFIGAVSIVDATGRVVRQLRVPAGVRYVQAGSLPVGAYSLVHQGGDARIALRFSVTE